jgi:hypothetical protein
MHSLIDLARNAMEKFGSSRKEKRYMNFLAVNFISMQYIVNLKLIRREILFSLQYVMSNGALQ